MKIKSSVYIHTCILLIMLAIIGASLTFPQIELKLLPIIVASFVFVLEAVELSKELKADDKQTLAEEKLPLPATKDTGYLRRFGIALSWLIGFSASIYLIGFLISIPAFICLYMKLCRRSWFTTIITAIITTAVIYGAFEIGLVTVLYRGLIFNLLF